MKTGRYSIKDLLGSNQIGQIIIPEIQRDYVWEKENVLRLLNSIYSNFNNKTSLKLNITNFEEGTPIEDEISVYLTKEYNKLHFNTRIGFIYAYHDRDYADKFFLIDGQQRITTIFLMLLAAYQMTGKCNEFRDKYFSGNVFPKVDYQVREVSHDFIIDFLKYELGNGSSFDGDDEFEKSRNFFNAYSLDVTAKSLLQNYKVIRDFFNKKISNRAADFLDYLENYIEFNYFDTNLSRQGERLYLYMNSRGEGLSDQESIKTYVIERSSDKDKLKAGADWEDWQNFFWINRGDNNNADSGFIEFIKWAVILHMEEFPDSDYSSFINIGDKNKSVDYREFYVRKGLDEQKNWIKSYIKVNKSFNIEWLRTVMNAVKKLKDFIDISMSDDCSYIKRCITEDWLSNVSSAIEYVNICGGLYYLVKFPDEGLKNFERLSMFLKNTCRYTTNIKNPDMAVIRTLHFVHWMYKNNVSNIIDIPYKNVGENKIKDNVIYKENDLRFTVLNTPDIDADKWELEFFKIIDSSLNEFLEGNPNILIAMMDGMYDNVDEFINIVSLFKKKIYERHKSDNLRNELLSYGDISVDGGGGSGHLGRWLHRYDIVSEDRAWRSFFNSKDGNGNYYASAIIKAYLIDKKELQKNDEFNYWIAKALGYMTQKKFLYQDDESVKSRCVLLKMHAASDDNILELPVFCLHKNIEDSWTWPSNFCVVNFDVVDDQIRTINIEDERNMHYYIDLWYDYNTGGGSWYCRIGHKEHDLPEEVIKQICDNRIGNFNWIPENGRFKNVIVEEPICKEEQSDDLFASFKIVEKWFKENLWKDLHGIKF